MVLERELLEWLIFGGEGGRRYTQSSPVLPDVWFEYGRNPGERQELLLTPHRDAAAGTIAVELRRRLRLPADGSRERGHHLVYTPTSVAVRLSLRELVGALLPMTSWWAREVHREERRGDGTEDEESSEARWSRLLEDRGALEDALTVAVEELEAALVQRARRRSGRRDPRKAPDPDDVDARAEPPHRQIPGDVVWMTWITGWLDWAEEAGPEALTEEDVLPSSPAELPDWLRAVQQKHPALEPRRLVRRALDLLAGRKRDGWKLPRPPADRRSRVWQINRNRGASLAVRDSRLAIKADAAWSLFDVSCESLAWAVIDSGIDARHPAFRGKNRSGIFYDQPFEGGRNRTRVKATYDFTRTRLLLNPALLPLLEEKPKAAEMRSEGPEGLPQTIRTQIDQLAATSVQRDALAGQVWDLRRLLGRADGTRDDRLRNQLTDLKKRLQAGSQIDWGQLEDLLRVPHRDEDYWAPASDHGTHVAGILAADWPQKKMSGVCPDLPLYDLRVLPSGVPGPEDELNVIAALQFVRHLNTASTDRVIHGANVSLSIPHAVASFACGRTPVCDECERVVASGVVVVAAAGNAGWQRYNTSKGPLDGYHTISITDPGNAESVITVGATHRNRPHTYGVSYFSSRGPTGDGRSKPDLVAPGEKITAPVSGGGSAEGEKDGTSMAAPHVSGAAAILMARHRELIGEAARIKKILCDTATDLGRERYFQGHGMLDVLRAIQSV